MPHEAIDYIIDRILNHGETDIARLKSEAAKKFGLEKTLKTSDIFQHIPKEKMTKEIHVLLKRKPMRTLSGVTPIAVMIRPEGSCNWQCIYCPFTGKAAKSYTGDEPAALRSRQNDYDAFKQARARLHQFEIGGHATDKCEVIVMGGTFLAMDKGYKTGFIKGIYDALNETKSDSIEDAKLINETAPHRVVGLTIETRPDVCTKEHIDEVLSYGATRVELGVQHPDDDLYKRTKRGHLTHHVVSATTNLKNAAFKVLYHVMPGQPGSSPQKDIEMVRRLFSDQSFRPDMVKIYPTLVIKGTELYDQMQRGEFEPYSSEEAADVISEFYRHIPRYVRVMRIQRDIPAPNIADGVKKSNLREMVEERIRRKNIVPQEIRMREIGLTKRKFDEDDFSLKRLDYGANGGREVFLSYENKDHSVIAGFIRLRIPHESHRKEIDAHTALIRELHVYGEEAALRARATVQHQGIGSALLSEAERIAQEEFDKRKVAVISGLGVREYYYRKGYSRDGPYVSKIL